MRTLVFFISLVFSFESFSCDYLLGTWKSSKSMSMEYNELHADLEEKQTSFLNQILGHMSISYTKSEVIEHASLSIMVTTNGKEHEFSFNESRYPYTAISCKSNSVDIEVNHPYIGEAVITINLIGKNIYWVSPEFLPSTREYFVRVQE